MHGGLISLELEALDILGLRTGLSVEDGTCRCLRVTGLSRNDGGCRQVKQRQVFGKKSYMLSFVTKLH